MVVVINGTNGIVAPGLTSQDSTGTATLTTSSTATIGGPLVVNDSASITGLLSAGSLAIGGTTITATAAELNYVDITTLGTSQASKVVTADANGDVNLSEELKAKSYNETYVTLSGTTPTVDCEAGNVFALTTSDNTTFTFSNPPASGTAFGFSLLLTAGGTHLVNYPASVDWAGATAPDAPGSDETDLLVFTTTDGGTTWYGALAIDAAG